MIFHHEQTCLRNHAFLGKVKNATIVTKVDQVNIIESDRPEFRKCTVTNKCGGKEQRSNKLDVVLNCIFVVTNHCYQGCHYHSTDCIDQVDYVSNSKRCGVIHAK